MKAITTIEISGRSIPTIPKGTEFEVTFRANVLSACKGLPINAIWNDEYELLPDEKHFDKSLDKSSS